MPENFTVHFSELGLYSRVISVTSRYFGQGSQYNVAAQRRHKGTYNAGPWPARARRPPRASTGAARAARRAPLRGPADAGDAGNADADGAAQMRGIRSGSAT